MIYAHELANDKEARRLRYEARKGGKGKASKRAARQASRILRQASQNH